MGIDDVFAVIAEGTRRQILRHLRDGDKAVGELVIELQVSQPTVSKHLKVLREAGLVTMRAQGQKRYYSLDTAPLGHVREWLAGFEAAGAQAPASTDPGAALQGRPDPAPETVSDAIAAAEPAEAGVLAAAVLAGPAPAEVDIPRPQIGRTMGRAAERAADLLSQLRRRRDPS
ncbi:helix-turn-helix transcriptional regulator [Arthrobacter sp. B0490]|uniref:ArsR/SmtB family transcription factor n=1 Tax=Arthrobacter sp. B0490 TaxID=2058891 RepID=UPI000CE45C78|nr:metalloregulator ArsR/SmtB family transcription factor [Arthrobacter sp. B0490]